MRISEDEGFDIGGEFEGAELGDRRRSRRLVEVGRTLAVNPALSFPKATGSDAALEGTYRLLGSDHVTSGAILEPHFRATLQRMEGMGEVTIVHDTTTFTFS